MTARPVAIVLSGGGAKAAAHLGAYRAVREAGFEPAWFVAASMGAVVAAGLASGVGHDELLEKIAAVGGRGVVRDPLAPVAGLFLRSLLRPAPLRRLIEEVVPARRFADLTIPLTVTAVDLDTGELVLFGAGAQVAPLIDVLCASCALPVYYPPVVLGGRRYGDGGLRGVVPLEPAAELDDELELAVDVGPGFDLPPTAEQTPKARSPCGAPISADDPWSMFALDSNGTPRSGSIVFASMLQKGVEPRVRLWTVGRATLDPSPFLDKLSP